MHAVYIDIAEDLVERHKMDQRWPEYLELNKGRYISPYDDGEKINEL